MVFVVGIDLSLTSTGVAALDVERGEVFTRAVTSTGTRKDPLQEHAARAWDLAARIIELVDRCQPALVVIESAYFNTGSTDSSAHRRAGVWWMVVATLARRYPVAEVAPAALKKFVTGKGTASKSSMKMAIAAAFGADVLTGQGARESSADDLADAAGLAAMGSYAAGRPCMPRTAQRNATIGAVAWPVVSSRLAPDTYSTADIPADGVDTTGERHG